MYLTAAELIELINNHSNNNGKIQVDEKDVSDLVKLQIEKDKEGKNEKIFNGILEQHFEHFTGNKQDFLINARAMFLENIKHKKSLDEKLRHINFTDIKVGQPLVGFQSRGDVFIEKLHQSADKVWNLIRDGSASLASPSHEEKIRPQADQTGGFPAAEEKPTFTSTLKKQKFANKTWHRAIVLEGSPADVLTKEVWEEQKKAEKKRKKASRTLKAARKAKQELPQPAAVAAPVSLSASPTLSPPRVERFDSDSLETLQVSEKSPESDAERSDSGPVSHSHEEQNPAPAAKSDVLSAAEENPAFIAVQAAEAAKEAEEAERLARAVEVKAAADRLKVEQEEKAKIAAEKARDEAEMLALEKAAQEAIEAQDREQAEVKNQAEDAAKVRELQQILGEVTNKPQVYLKALQIHQKIYTERNNFVAALENLDDSESELSNQKKQEHISRLSFAIDSALSVFPSKLAEFELFRTLGANLLWCNSKFGTLKVSLEVFKKKISQGDKCDLKYLEQLRADYTAAEKMYRYIVTLEDKATVFLIASLQVIKMELEQKENALRAGIEQNVERPHANFLLACNGITENLILKKFSKNDQVNIQIAVASSTLSERVNKQKDLKDIRKEAEKLVPKTSWESWGERETYSAKSLWCGFGARLVKRIVRTAVRAVNSYKVRVDAVVAKAALQYAEGKPERNGMLQEVFTTITSLPQKQIQKHIAKYNADMSDSTAKEASEKRETLKILKEFFAPFFKNLAVVHELGLAEANSLMSAEAVSQARRFAAVTPAAEAKPSPAYTVAEVNREVSAQSTTLGRLGGHPPILGAEEHVVKEGVAALALARGRILVSSKQTVTKAAPNVGSAMNPSKGTPQIPIATPAPAA